MSRQEEIISLLRNPSSGEALDAEDGVLIDSVSGEQFTIRDGIPVILRPDDIYGWNRTAQRGYDWLSLVYDFIYRFNLGNIQTWLNEIATIIEIHPKDRVLETSVGPDSNFATCIITALKGDSMEMIYRLECCAGAGRTR